MSCKLFDITTPDDLDEVGDYIDDTYNPMDIIEGLKQGLDPFCKKLLLETDYNDKGCRSIYDLLREEGLPPGRLGFLSASSTVRSDFRSELNNRR